MGADDSINTINIPDGTLRLQISHVPFEVPAKYADHPLVNGRLFCTLPLQLIAALQAEVRLGNLDPELMDLERQMATSVAAYPLAAGVWNNEPLTSWLLKRPTGDAFLDKATVQQIRACKGELGWGQIPQNREPSALRDPIDQSRLQGRGYCAWLLTNPEFLREHDAFFRRYRKLLVEHHTPQVGLPAGTPTEAMAPADKRRAKCLADFAQLLRRWQLLHLPGPYLPEPLLPQTVILLPQQAEWFRRPGIVTMMFPTHLPAPDRDTLKRHFDDAHAAEADQTNLRGWRAILNNRKTAHSSIARYSRLFELRHFWLVLHRRWGNRLRRQTERLEYAFAGFLFDQQRADDAKRELVHKDLQFIRRRVGDSDWCRRPSILDQL